MEDLTPDKDFRILFPELRYSPLEFNFPKIRNILSIKRDEIKAMKF